MSVKTDFHPTQNSARQMALDTPHRSRQIGTAILKHHPYLRETMPIQQEQHKAPSAIWRAPTRMIWKPALSKNVYVQVRVCVYA